MEVKVSAHGWLQPVIYILTHPETTEQHKNPKQNPKQCVMQVRCKSDDVVLFHDASSSDYAVKQPRPKVKWPLNIRWLAEIQFLL